MSSFKTLDQFPTVGCTEQQSLAIFQLTIGELGSKDGHKDTELEELIAVDPLSKIITARVNAAGGKMTPHLTALIVMISEGNPGNAIMLTHAVHMATPTGEESDIKRFVDVFPNGFPNQQSLSECWDNQKSGMGGNLIDLLQEWKR